MTVRPSQCDRVLAALADGSWHNIGEIHAAAGTMRLNSRVAELRTRGHRIVHTIVNGEHGYTLLPRLEEVDAPEPPSTSSSLTAPAGGQLDLLDLFGAAA